MQVIKKNSHNVKRCCAMSGVHLEALDDMGIDNVLKDEEAAATIKTTHQFVHCILQRKEY